MHVQELQFQFFFLHAPVANSTMHADSTERLHTLMPQALSLFKSLHFRSTCIWLISLCSFLLQFAGQAD